MSRKAAAYFEVRKFLRQEWLVMASMLLALFVRSAVKLRDLPPLAATFGGSIRMWLFVVSLVCLTRLLIGRGDDRFYVRSRPINFEAHYPWRLAKTLLLLLLLSAALAPPSVRELPAHSDQVRVGGCAAIAEYEAAGLAPRFDAQAEQDLYARFRAGDPKASCHFFATITVPALGSCVHALQVLIALLMSAILLISTSFFNRSPREFMKTPVFWFAFVPVVLGVLQIAEGFEATVFTNSNHLIPLQIYQAMEYLIAAISITAAVYLTVSYRVWKRMEVFA